jgi:T5SS/PEP-CTERM-associated repeat protein
MDYSSPLACKAGPSAICLPPDTPPNPPPMTRGSYQVTLEVTPAGPDGNVFRWIGPTQGGFGNDQNWDPTGVPAFVPDTRSDTALFQDVEARVDVNALANLAAPATGGRAGTVPGCAGPITRTIGRLLLDATSDVTLFNGALALDGISLADPALTLQDQGLLQLGDATICVLDAAIGASGRPSFAFVQGPGGVLQTRERLSIGVDGKGTLTVRDGGIATCAVVRIVDGNAAGFADVSTATWHTGNVAVGFLSPGELTIENAGLVESEQGFVQFGVPLAPVARFGSDPAARCLGRSDGSGVEVRGQLSTWRLQHLEIGGGGCVEVRDHGLLDAIAGDSALGEVQIATTTNGEATLAVDNARVTTASTVVVGDRGSGRLEIVDHDLGGTRVQVSGLVVGRSLPGEDGGGEGVVTVRGDLFTDDDLLVTDTINVADEHGIGELSIQPRARVTTATSALVSPDGGIGEVTLLGDPQTADPETKTRWNIGTSLQVGIDGFSIPTGTISIADAAINVGSPSAAGQVTIRQSGVVIGRGQRINLIRTNGGTIRNDGQIFGPVTLDGSYDPASTGAIVSQNAAPTPPPPAPLSPAEARAVKVPPLPQGALVVTGDADFTGTTLVLQFLNGFAPHQGDVLPVVQVGGQVAHGFAAVQVLGLAPGATFDVDAASGTATALNDTVALPAVTISAKATLKESEKKGLKVKLTRTGPKTAPLTVHYRVRGSARSGIDFGALPGVLTIPVKKKSATFLVRPIADGFIEPAETIVIEVLPGDDYAPSLLSKATITLVSTEKKPKKR